MLKASKVKYTLKKKISAIGTDGSHLSGLENRWGDYNKNGHEVFQTEPFIKKKDSIAKQKSQI